MFRVEVHNISYIRRQLIYFKRQANANVIGKNLFKTCADHNIADLNADAFFTNQ